MWFERAGKTLEQLNHLSLLIDQFEFMADVSHRMQEETIPELKASFKDETDEQLKKAKYKHI